MSAKSKRLFLTFIVITSYDLQDLFYIVTDLEVGMSASCTAAG